MRRLLDLLDDGEGASLAPQPGLDQLERLLADTRAAGAEVDLTITGTPLELPAGVELAGFRILQESLTNVLKHARPPRAHVRVAYEPDAIVVEVRDEGQSGKKNVSKIFSTERWKKRRRSSELISGQR
jgi:signal transduction histidine kinase